MRVATVIGIVIVSTILIVGVIIFGNLKSTVEDLNLGTQGNATRTSIINTTYNAFNITTIGLIVMGAMGIIGGILTAFRGSGGGGF